MAESKISDLSNLASASVANIDLLPIVDTSAAETKKITVANLEGALFTGGDESLSVSSLSTDDVTSTNDISVGGSGNIFGTLISNIEANTQSIGNQGGNFVTLSTVQDITAKKVFDNDIGFNGNVIIGSSSASNLESSTLAANSNGALEVNSTLNGGSTSIYASNDIVAFSDISVKDNVRPIPHAIQKVKRLKGRLYNRNDSDDLEKIHMGLIAQEVEQVIPEVVKDLSDGKKAVAYQNIIGLLIEAIKDQQKQIDDLKNKIK